MKDWLIRTKSNYILGPVAKEKVLELLEQGTINDDDEICKGNGYWFYLREKDLVSKYLLEDAHQEFNPVTEATYDRSTSPANGERSEPEQTDDFAELDHSQHNDDVHESSELPKKEPTLITNILEKKLNQDQDQQAAPAANTEESLEPNFDEPTDPTLTVRLLKKKKLIILLVLLLIAGVIVLGQLNLFKGKIG